MPKHQQTQAEWTVITDGAGPTVAALQPLAWLLLAIAERRLRQEKEAAAKRPTHDEHLAIK